jgi:hypothetical protein
VQIVSADGTPGRVHVGYLSADDLLSWLGNK